MKPIADDLANQLTDDNAATLFDDRPMQAGTIDQIVVDLDALPDALLPLVKEQARVDHSDDDAYIKRVIKRAIAHRENVWNININPATVVWAPASTDFCNGKAAAPLRPIAAMTATAAIGDVTANYDLSRQGQFGAPPYLIYGAWQDGLMLSFEVGYSAATLPPGIEDNIMTLCCHLYEHREIFMDKDPGMVPTPSIDSETPFWVPRA